MYACLLLVVSSLYKIQTLQGKLKIRHLNLPHGSIRISHHMLDSLSHSPATHNSFQTSHTTSPHFSRNWATPSFQAYTDAQSNSSSVHKNPIHESKASSTVQSPPHETPRDEGIKRNIHKNSALVKYNPAAINGIWVGLGSIPS